MYICVCIYIYTTRVRYGEHAESHECLGDAKVPAASVFVLLYQ